MSQKKNKSEKKMTFFGMQKKRRWRGKHFLQKYRKQLSAKEKKSNETNRTRASEALETQTRTYC